MKVPNFKEYLTEEKHDKPRLVIITDEPEKAKTFHTADRLQEEAKKLGWDYSLTLEEGIRRTYEWIDSQLNVTHHRV